MKKFFVYEIPESGEPFRFVVGVGRRWLFWRKAVFSNVPICVQVDDGEELSRLALLASTETDRVIVTCEEEMFRNEHRCNMFWAVRKKTDSIEKPQWYTGRWCRKSDAKSIGPETVTDIRDCQLFVRECYAIEALSRLNRDGHDGVLERVYVNVDNIFEMPNIVVICVNRRTERVRYLKGYKEGDPRLRYTEHVNDAMLLFPEETEKVYEYLITHHKDISFTMVAKPNEDIPASDLRNNESKLVQRMACDFYIRGHEEKKQA